MLTILNGDCLELMKDISANSVDLIICDLPYGCLGRGASALRENSEGAFGRDIKWDVPIDLDTFWKEIKRIRRNEHSPTIHFCTTKFGFDLYASNPKEFRYDIVWDKQRGVSFLSANKMPMRSHEMIYVFSKAGAYYNRVDISGNFKGWEKKTEANKIVPVYSSGMPNGWRDNGNNGSTRCALSVIPQPGVSKKGGHPTEKPMALYEWLIARYCPANGTVLDPTGGSCNSAFQAHAMGRNAIAIEKDKTFYDKAIARKNSLAN